MKESVRPDSGHNPSFTLDVSGSWLLAFRLASSELCLGSQSCQRPERDVPWYIWGRSYLHDRRAGGERAEASVSVLEPLVSQQVWLLSHSSLTSLTDEQRWLGALSRWFSSVHLTHGGCWARWHTVSRNRMSEYTHKAPLNCLHMVLALSALIHLVNTNIINLVKLKCSEVTNP